MSYVNYSVAQGVAVVSIRRPEALNALSREIVDELDALLDTLAADSAVKCLVFYNEKNFAAGADIKAMADCDPAGAAEFSFSPTFNKLAAFPVPTVAAIEGYALGGGLELALCCDIRLCAEGARLGFPEITLGIMPGAGGTVRAPRLLGAGRAMEMIFTGSPLTAQEALHAGLVNRVTAPEELSEAAMKLGRRIAAQSRVALTTAKRTILAGLAAPDVERGVEIEAANWAGLFSSHDQKEGMHAFMEKRKPVYEDR